MAVYIFTTPGSPVKCCFFFHHDECVAFARIWGTCGSTGFEHLCRDRDLQAEKCKQLVFLICTSLQQESDQTCITNTHSHIVVRTLVVGNGLLSVTACNTRESIPVTMTLDPWEMDAEVERHTYPQPGELLLKNPIDHLYIVTFNHTIQQVQTVGNFIHPQGEQLSQTTCTINKQVR